MTTNPTVLPTGPTAPRGSKLYWQQRAYMGDACSDENGNCLGCGKDIARVADNALDGCIVCDAWLAFLAGEEIVW